MSAKTSSCSSLTRNSAALPISSSALTLKPPKKRGLVKKGVPLRPNHAAHIIPTGKKIVKSNKAV